MQLQSVTQKCGGVIQSQCWCRYRLISSSECSCTWRLGCSPAATSSAISSTRDRHRSSSLRSARARALGHSVPKTLPRNHISWTQALLFDSILRKAARRRHQSGATCAHYLRVKNGAILISGEDVVRSGGVLPCILLGRGEGIVQSVAAPMPGLMGVKVQSIYPGPYHIFALSADGTVYSWGDGMYGKLGHGDEEDVALPKPIAALREVRALATHRAHSLAVTSDGALWSWGCNCSMGILGHGVSGNDDPLPPQQICLMEERMRFCSVAVGMSHSVAADVEGRCFTWGDDQYGQLFNMSLGAGHLSFPTLIPELIGKQVSSVAAYFKRSCAVTVQGDIWMWGAWSSGVHPPLRISGTPLDGHRVVSVAMHYLHCLALTDEGNVFSWFIGDVRTLPDGTLTEEALRDLARFHPACLAQRGVYRDTSGKFCSEPRRTSRDLISLRVYSIAVGRNCSFFIGAEDHDAPYHRGHRRGKVRRSRRRHIKIGYLHSSVVQGGHEDSEDDSSDG